LTLNRRTNQMTVRAVDMHPWTSVLWRCKSFGTSNQFDFGLRNGW